MLNLAHGTFHPKLYLACHGDRLTAAVGSAHLTSGLVANVEVVAVLCGRDSAPQLQSLWALAQSWWHHDDAVDWSPDRISAAKEVLEPALLGRIEAAVAIDTEVPTLGDRKPNWIQEITSDGVWVETLRSRAAGRPPQLVEAWMIQVAWDYLNAHGSLTNRHLLDNNGLNVKRSSFVCALLARLLDVEVTSTRPITLTLGRVHPRAALSPAESV